MTKLIIKHKGQILQEMVLQPSEEYSIGRSQDNAIVLPEQAGISRKHLSLLMGEDGQWLVKNLSSTGALIIDGNTTEEGAVPVGGSFQTQDFEFILMEEEKKSSAKSAKETDQKPSSSQKSALLEQKSVALYKKTESQIKPESETKEESPQDSLVDSSLDNPPLLWPILLKTIKQNFEYRLPCCAHICLPKGI